MFEQCLKYFIKFLSKYHCACKAEHISCTAFFDFATASGHIEKCPCKGIRNVPGIRATSNPNRNGTFSFFLAFLERREKANINFFFAVLLELHMTHSCQSAHQLLGGRKSFSFTLVDRKFCLPHLGG